MHSLQIVSSLVFSTILSSVALAKNDTNAQYWKIISPGSTIWNIASPEILTMSLLDEAMLKVKFEAWENCLLNLQDSVVEDCLHEKGYKIGWANGTATYGVNGHWLITCAYVKEDPYQRDCKISPLSLKWNFRVIYT